MSKSYVIAAPAALVNVEGSYAALMHHGAVLPDGVDPVQLQHLIDTGIVVEGAPVGGLEPAVVVKNGRAVRVPFTESDADPEAADQKAAEEAEAKAKAEKAAADAKAKADAEALAAARAKASQKASA